MIDIHIVKITQKYIIDMLNATCFSESLNWSGVDQYNALPVFFSEADKDEKTEQRGVLLVHKKLATALRVLITAVGNASQRICYRILNLHKKIELDDPRRILSPMEYIKLDFSIADTNLGLRQDSSYTFSYNCDVGNASKEVVFNLLSFLLNSEFVALEDKTLFDDVLSDVISFPPFPGDPHFKPVFGIVREQT